MQFLFQQAAIPVCRYYLDTFYLAVTIHVDKDEGLEFSYGAHFKLRKMDAHKLG